MKMRSMISVFWACVIGVLGADTASSQPFPARPIRLITSAPGGGNDFAARLVAQGLSTNLGQQVVVDNRSSYTAPDLVVKAPPDGYTLLLYGSSFWINGLLRKAPYDAVADFSPIILTGVSPNLLALHPSVPANSVKDLIALAKAKPGALNYGTGSSGSTAHLGMELFKYMLGVNIVRISYKGSGPATNALMAGEVQMMINSGSVLSPHAKSGKLKALAVTSLQPSALAPGLPTIAAAGLPGYEMISADAIFAPAKTPTAVVNRLNQEIARVVSRPEVTERFQSVGVEVLGGPPQQLSARINADITNLGKLIKDVGIQGE